MSTNANPPDRRLLLQWWAFGLGALASVALAIPIVGYLIGTLIKRQLDDWVDLGPVGDFPERQTKLVEFLLPQLQPWDGQCRKASAYVRHKDDGGFQAFAVNCAHLGCPVSWFPSSGLFLCPCHGGVYYEDGSHASGPPPRGLYQYDVRLLRNGKAVAADEFARLTQKIKEAKDDEQKKALMKERDALRVEIKAGHVPTLQDPLRKHGKGEKA